MMGNIDPNDLNLNDAVIQSINALTAGLTRALELDRQRTEEAREQNDLLDEAVERTQQELENATLEAEIRRDSAKMRKDLSNVDYKHLGTLKGIGAVLSNHAKLYEDIKKTAENKAKIDEKIGKLQSQIDVTGDNKLKKKLEALKAQYQAQSNVNASALQAQQAAMGSSFFGKLFGGANGAAAAAAGGGGGFGGMMAKLFGGGGAGGPYMMIAQKIAGYLFKAAGFIWDIFKTVLGFIWNRVKEIAKVFLDIQSIIGNLVADLGMSVVQTDQLYANMGNIGKAALMFGVSFKEAAGFMRTFSDLTGINRVFLAEQVTDLSAIAKATGLGAEQTGQMYANMELLGMSTSQFHKYVNDTRATAGRLNLNITKLLTTVNTLQPAFRALNFREGIAGLTKIIEKAQGLRFDLSNMRSLADKVFNPEGAVELAAKLRVLGGSFARMADPFALMLKGQTDAAGLMNDVMESLAGMAVKGKDGLFSISPVQQAIIREVASAMGENADNMITGAIQMAKQADIMGKMRVKPFMSDDDKTLIKNLAEQDEKGGYYIKVDAQGTKVAIDQITKSQMDAIRQYQSNETGVARNRMNIIEKFKNIYDMFLISLAPVFNKLSDALQKKGGIMDYVSKTLDRLSNFLLEKLNKAFSDGSFEKLLDRILMFMETLVNIIIDPNKSIVGKLGAVIGEAIKAAFGGTGQAGQLLNQVGLGKPIRQTGRVMGALGGAGAGVLAGTAIGSLFGGVGAIPGAVIGGLIGLLGGGVAGGFAGDYFSKKIAPSPADDFIMRSNGMIQKFRKDDLVLGGTQLLPKRDENVANMVTSRSLLEQTKVYNKSQFANLNVYLGGSKGSQEPISININGTLQVKSDDKSVYLTSADLRNIGLQQLYYMVDNEGKRFNNHQTSKRLPSEIITPIRHTS